MGRRRGGGGRVGGIERVEVVMSSKEEVIVIEGMQMTMVTEVLPDQGGKYWYALVTVTNGNDPEKWFGPCRTAIAGAERDAASIRAAALSLADGYVAPVPEQPQALTSALMDVERYKALHQTTAAGWQRTDEEAREADRALRIMSLRLHDVETALARVTAERDEARRALGVRDGGAS